MRIIIAVPYTLKTSGTIEFAARLSKCLRAMGLDSEIACCQEQQGSESEFTCSPVDHMLPDGSELIRWIDSQYKSCDVIFWAGIFQNAEYRKRQIQNAVFARNRFATKMIFLWERTGHSSVVPEFALFRTLITDGADVIAALNPSHQRMLIDRGAPQEKVKLFSPGVDTRDTFLIPQPEKRLEIRERHGWARRETIVLALARLVRRKRIDFIVESWRKSEHLCSNARLLIVGSGFGAPDSNERTILSLSKDEPSIRTIIYKNGMDHQQFYTAADVFVTASELEGEPTTLHEAMACGLPVVASDIPGHRTLVQHGETGFLFDLRNQDALTGHLGQLTGDSLIRRQMADEARLSIVSKRDIMKIAEQFLAMAGRNAVSREAEESGLAVSRSS